MLYIVSVTDVSLAVFKFYAVLAQLAEHLTCNHEVSGSIPEDGSAIAVIMAIVVLSGSFQSGQMGQTVNLLAQPSKVRILHSPIKRLGDLPLS